MKEKQHLVFPSPLAGGGRGRGPAKRHGGVAPDDLLRAYQALAPQGKLWVAYSGGLDSTVLLHLLKTAGLRPRAIHVNHQLQPAAATWARHCAQVCKSLRVPLVVKHVRVAADDPAGPEAAARQARYAALREPLQQGDVLAAAHHRDDQAETVLLRALRGTGIQGLAAMRPQTPFAPGRLWRPLLELPRAALRAYAQAQRLHWIEDPHNAEPRYARSWLRAAVLPLLRERWPALDDNLARLARLAAETDALLRELGQADLAAARANAVLRVSALLALDPARRHNALRLWLEEQGAILPAAEWMVRLDDEVLAAAPDATPVLTLGELELRRYRDELHLMPRLPPAPQDAVLEWRTARLELPPGCGRLHAGRKPPEPLRVRFAQGGERIKPAGARHTRTLKNLFQEAGLPPWLRERMPLIYRERRLVAVADRWRTAEFRAYCEEHALHLRWRHALIGDCAP